MRKKKKTKKILCVIALATLFFICAGTAFAEDSADTDSTYEESLEEIKRQLPDSVARYLDDSDTRNENGVINGFLGVINGILSDFRGLLRDPLRLFGLVCAVLIICAAAGVLGRQDSRIPSRGTVALVGSLAISGAVSAVVMTAVQSAISTIETAGQFVNGFIPVYAGLLVSSGQVTSAAMFSGGILGAATVASSVITNFVRPITGVILGLSIVSGINDNGMTVLADGLRKTIMWVMGIVASLFVGLMGLQGMVSKQTDNLALRTTRYLVGSSIPVIGSSVSEAVSTVSGSFQVIRATVGSAGIIALCGVFLPEILRLILCSMAMSLAAGVGEIVGTPGLARSIRTVKGAVDIITAVMSFYFIALAACTAIMISTGG